MKNKTKQSAVTIVPHFPLIVSYVGTVFLNKWKSPSKPEFDDK